MDEDFFKKMGESTQFGANLSSLRNADETEKVRQLLEQQQKEQQRTAALPGCPHCGTKIPKIGVKICGQCRSKLGWVGNKPCEPGQEAAIQTRISREKEHGKRRAAERQRRESERRISENKERQKREIRHQKWLLTKEGVKHTERQTLKAGLWVFFGVPCPPVILLT